MGEESLGGGVKRDYYWTAFEAASEVELDSCRRDGLGNLEGA